MAISNAFPSDRVARGTAIETLFEAVELTEPKGRPVNIFAFGVADAAKSVAAEPYQFVSLADTATKFGYGSTIYQTCKRLKPADAIGIGSIPLTLFPLEVTAGGQAAGSITPLGTCSTSQTYVVKVSNKLSLNIDMVATETVADWTAKALAAVNGVLDMQMTAADGTTVLNMTSRIETAAGEEYFIEVESPADADMTFTIVQPTGGAGSVDYATLWAVFNDNWYSHVLNGYSDVTDSTYLNSSEAFGELRWSPSVYKPFKSYTGTNEATLATVTAITDARKSDRVNTIKHSPGSNNTPWDIAARMLAMTARTSAADPAQDPQLRACSGLTVGPASSQLDSDARQLAVTKGLSTMEVVSGVVNISDSIMCYHPVGEDPPGFRYDVDIEKECAMIYNIALIFTNPADAGNPLVPDDQTTTNVNARKPSYFKNKLNKLFDGAALAGIISDPQYAKDNTIVQISGTNPKRLDVLDVHKLSGNVSVISITNKFTFYVGGGE